VNTASHDLPARLGRAGAVRATLAAWRNAIASLGPGPWKWAGLIGLFGTVLECALVLGERRPSVPVRALIPIFEATSICWAVQVSFGLCAWAIASRSGAPTERRVVRLAVWLMVAVLLQAALVPGLVDALVGRVDPCVFHGCEDKDWSKVPSWLLYSEDTGHMLIFAGLVFAWLEAHRRNREIEQRLLASQQERGRLQRSAFDARLTAMRAQVDPQFLFDSLADVQSAYAVDTARGTATLDCLIAYLRTALPRLRTEGSTIGAEAELVDAWLAVVAARRNGQPARRLQIEPSCCGVPLPATVLLPLVQWAMGDAAAAARDVCLRAWRVEPGAGRVVAQLQVTPGRACGEDDAQPRRIRSRMQAMYGEAASLRCVEEPAREVPEAGNRARTTVITLQWPDESADRDRR
jgi:hypothetical protein